MSSNSHVLFWDTIHNAQCVLSSIFPSLHRYSQFLSFYVLIMSRPPVSRFPSASHLLHRFPSCLATGIIICLLHAVPFILSVTFLFVIRSPPSQLSVCFVMPCIFWRREAVEPPSRCPCFNFAVQKVTSSWLYLAILRSLYYHSFRGRSLHVSPPEFFNNVLL